MPVTNLNRVTLVGTLTKDPELKSTQSGTSVCELRIANNGATKRSGTWEQKPNFFQVVVWGGQADNAEKYLRTGSKIAVDGQLEWQSWENSETGKQNSRVVIQAQNVEFLTPKSKDDDKPANKPDDAEPDSKPASDDDDIPF